MSNLRNDVKNIDDVAMFWQLNIDKNYLFKISSGQRNVLGGLLDSIFRFDLGRTGFIQRLNHIFGRFQNVLGTFTDIRNGVRRKY